MMTLCCGCVFFFFQAEDGIRDVAVTGVQTCALRLDVPPGRARARALARAPGPPGLHPAAGAATPPGPRVAQSRHPGAVLRDRDRAPPPGGPGRDGRGQDPAAAGGDREGAGGGDAGGPWTNAERGTRNAERKAARQFRVPRSAFRLRMTHTTFALGRLTCHALEGGDRKSVVEGKRVDLG